MSQMQSSDALVQGSSVFGNFMDLQKAFDSVLGTVGVRGVVSFNLVVDIFLVVVMLVILVVGVVVPPVVGVDILEAVVSGTEVVEGGSAAVVDTGDGVVGTVGVLAGVVFIMARAFALFGVVLIVLIVVSGVVNPLVN